jgi:hypothetical protein
VWLSRTLEKYFATDPTVASMAMLLSLSTISICRLTSPRLLRPSNEVPLTMLASPTTATILGADGIADCGPGRTGGDAMASA